jgi:hypothetical protein
VREPPKGSIFGKKCLKVSMARSVCPPVFCCRSMTTFWRPAALLRVMNSPMVSWNVPIASPYSSKLGILSTEIEVEFRKYPDGASTLA